MKIRLQELSLGDGRDIYDMLQTIPAEEQGFHNAAYGIAWEDFGEYLRDNIQMARGIGLPEYYVPQTIYWLYADDEPVGIVKLRHFLNDNLRKQGGHIGYCIKPSARGKGYGTRILAEILHEARRIHIPEALLTCNEDNLRSRRVIEANGGVMEKTDDGKCYYWIELS